MEKVKTIILKEWAEVFRNRLVLFTVAFLPAILTALPLIMLAVTGDMGDELVSANAPPGELIGTLCDGVSELECTQVYTLNLFALMFMILPIAIPVTIAAYSIVGEKTRGSLEPLLATPITTIELVAGKAVAAVIPAIAAIWLSYFIFLSGVRLMVNDVVFARLLDPLWWIGIFAVAPLLTLMSVSIAIMISSRVSDPRVAEQLSALVVLPVIMLIVGQSVGWILLDQRLIIIIGAVVLLLDVVLIYGSVRIFQRENILTRWK